MARTTTKTITSAIPTVRISDNKVVIWDVTVTYTDTVTSWSIPFTYSQDVSANNLYANQFTKSTLLSYAPSSYDTLFDTQFSDAHVPAANVTTTLSNFDFRTLS